MFLELMPLPRERTLLVTVSRIGEQLKVNVIPTKVKEGEDEALTTPLSSTAARSRSNLSSRNLPNRKDHANGTYSAKQQSSP
jgi:hypothetical protein